METDTRTFADERRLNKALKQDYPSLCRYEDLKPNETFHIIWNPFGPTNPHLIFRDRTECQDFIITKLCHIHDPFYVMTRCAQSNSHH